MLAGCVCCLALLLDSSATAQTLSAGATQDAIRLQQLAKRRYQELARIMTETSRRLEATDPKTAATIAAASQKAEAALIGNEMDKVVELLQSGMVIPADATQATVILRLREVLSALKGEGGLEWRLFLLEEIRQQLMALAQLVERQQALEIKSRMLAFGDEMRTNATAAKGEADALLRLQEDVLERTRRLSPAPASAELGGIRQSFVGILQRFEVAKDALWKPVPSSDELSRNIVSVRSLFAETATLRSSLRTLLNRDDMKRAMTAPAAIAGGTNMLETVGRAADEFDKSAKAMTAGDVAEGILALSEAKALLQEALTGLEETVQSFPDVQPAVKIAEDQKKVDDGASQLQSTMRLFVAAGSAVVDDSPEEQERTAREEHHLAFRQKVWKQQSPVMVVLDPAGTATRQEQSVERLRDWSERLGDAGREIERLKEDPGYPAQKKAQEGIVADLRSVLDANKSQGETVGDDTQLTQIFSVLRTAMENASDYGVKAVNHLDKEMPKEANTNQNDVIHLLKTVMDAVGPELKMDANKYAMNEQAQARIQRMIIKQKICLGETKVVWGKRPADGAYGRPDRLRMEAIAKDEKSIQDDADVCWEIMNTSHNIKYNVFPAEARLMLELARADMKVAEKRLLGMDPGVETQDVEQRIIDRLKSTEKLLAQENKTQAKELDRKFTYDSFLSRGAINALQRVPILEMWIALQEDINRRTAEIDKVRRAGKADADTDREAEQLRQIQENIRVGLDEYAREDAMQWMNADKVSTFGNIRKY